MAMATTKKRVEQYLTARAQQPFCDFCLMNAIGARERQIVQKATSELAAHQPSRFQRRKRLCANSGQTNHITRPKLCIAYLGGVGTG